jgi:hypothetical protein
MTDADLEQSLLQSSELLLKGHSNERLRRLLLSEYGDIQYAFVIDCIPEQAEDIYTVVIPPDKQMNK